MHPAGMHKTLRAGTCGKGDSTLVHSTKPTFGVLCGYVELNPVRAAMVDAAEHWAWSSAAAHCNAAAASPLLEMESWRSRWTAVEWREHLPARDSSADAATLRRFTHTGRPLGSPEFVARLKQCTLRPLGPRKPGRPKKPSQDPHQ